MDKVKIGVIGGSGLYELIENPEYMVLKTPFGETPRIEVGHVKGRKVAFLPRHGKPGVKKKVGHAVPPFKINFKANVYGLRMLGVERIIATNACGSLNMKINPGDIVLPDQFIDFTKLRETTFFDGETAVSIWRDKPPIKTVAHVDFTDPYCPELRKLIFEACVSLGLKCHVQGTYVCTEGPRFETPAEIKMFRVLGGDVVGMTSIPEAVLARELTMCYASVSVSTNWAAGISKEKITHEEVVDLFSKRITQVREIIKRAILAIPKERRCRCKDALKGALPR